MRFTTIRLPDGPSLTRALAEHVWSVSAAHVRDGIVDLSDALVMVPASRASRACERHLVSLAREAGQAFIAPRVVTPAGLASRFVVPSASVLGSLGIQLSWRNAIISAEARVISALSPGGIDAVPGEPLEPASIDALAARIAILHRDVTSACSDFSSVAAELRATMPELDLARWDALIALESGWRSTLEREQSIDESSGTRAACRAGALHAGGISRIFVLLADPERIQRELLGALSDRGVAISILVHGTHSELPAPLDSDGFPEHAAWARAAVVVPQDIIMLADTPADQAAAVLDALVAMPAPRRSCDMAVAVPDEGVAAQVASLLPSCGVAVNPLPSRTASDGPLGMLLAAVADHLRIRSCATAGVLVRHPEMEAWLIQQGCSRPVATMSEYAASSGADGLPDRIEFAAGNHDRMAAIIEHIDQLLLPLSKSKSAVDTVLSLRKLLGTVSRDASPSGRESAKAFHAAAEELLAVPVRFTADLDSAQFLVLIREAMTATILSTEGSDDGIELMQWLDAGIDDAPDMVLTGMNDGIVPGGMEVDPWLPDSVRARLGMPCAMRRQARDAWILHALLSRKRFIRLVTGRTQMAGDPLQPSRLLLGLQGEELARRMAWIGDPKSVRSSVARWSAMAANQGEFSINLVPTGASQVKSISVTAFRDYLRCPALFRLKRDPRLLLDGADDGTVELDPMGFGNLVHAALQAWGRDEAERTASGEPAMLDAAAIEQRVHAALDAIRNNDYPQSIRGAYIVQFALARERLTAFAHAQAAWAAEGWRVVHSEISFAMHPRDQHGRPAPVIGTTGLYLQGRIDRVDMHPTRGYAALDYKTSMKAMDPEGEHRKPKGRWLDLQLPLYAVLLRSVGIAVPPENLGYFALPSNPADTAVLLASTWDGAFLGEAEAEAERIAEAIVAGEFTRDPDYEPDPDDPLAPVYGVGMRGLRGEVVS
jgi:ATP-dependent helicase/nuclease subunit B